MTPSSIQRTNGPGQRLIKGFESCALRAYPDPKTGGVPWTIGWGATGPGIGPGTVWTQEEADARFLVDLSGFESIVRKAVYVALTDNQFAAMVSIVFNVGPGSSRKDGIVVLKTGAPSTLLRLLNQARYGEAAAQFPRWCSPGTSVTNGLLRRRNAERVLFETP